MYIKEEKLNIYDNAILDIVVYFIEFLHTITLLWKITQAQMTI